MKLRWPKTDYPFIRYSTTKAWYGCKAGNQRLTLVDNHDTQPLQSLEAPVEDWFKPLARMARCCCAVVILVFFILISTAHGLYPIRGR